MFFWTKIRAVVEAPEAFIAYRKVFYETTEFLNTHTPTETHIPFIDIAKVHYHNGAFPLCLE